MKLTKLFVLIIFFLSVDDLFSQEMSNEPDLKIESEAYKLLDKQVPNFEALTLNGSKITQDNFKGQVSILQFMYFPCGPCMAEIPHLNKLYKKYSELGLKIYAVIPNRPIDIESFQNGLDSNSIYVRFRRRLNYEAITYEIIPECKDNNIETKENSIGIDCNEISKIFLCDYYPINFLIDKDGIIRYIFVGFEKYNQEQEIMQIDNKINQLLIEN